MKNIFNEVCDIESKTYGSNVHLALIGLDAEAYDHISERFRKLAEDGHITEDGMTRFDMFSTFCVADDYKWHPTYAAQEMHKEFAGALEKAWFSRISREQALAVLNVMAITSELSSYAICHGAEYSAYTFMDCWNVNHPDEEPIRINPDMLVNI